MIRSRPTSGFTLIEILVAMTILAFGLAMVTLGFGQLADRDLQAEGTKITAWMQSLSDRAILEGGIYGFRVVENQLQAVSWYDHQWLVVEHEGLLSLPANIHFESAQGLPQAGFVTELENPRGGDSEPALNSRRAAPLLLGEDEIIEPLMVFMPSGEPMTAGEIFLIRTSGERLRQYWMLDGSIAYELPTAI